jgi:hypothetical protein
VDACLHARTKLSWAASSAATRSRRIENVSPNTRRWKRRTKSAAASGSPDPSPASSDSSDSSRTTDAPSAPRVRTGSATLGGCFLERTSTSEHSPPLTRRSPLANLGPAALGYLRPGAIRRLRRPSPMSETRSRSLVPTVAWGNRGRDAIGLCQYSPPPPPEPPPPPPPPPEKKTR